MSRKHWMWAVVFSLSVAGPVVAPTIAKVAHNHERYHASEAIEALTVAEGSSTDKHTRHLLWVKYRSTPVDVSDKRFEPLDTSKSSFVTGAWYDESNSYMIIGLNGTYYHYCRMPRAEWDSFRAADSFGRYYISNIKGRYDCRLGGVPEY